MKTNNSMHLKFKTKTFYEILGYIFIFGLKIFIII